MKRIKKWLYGTFLPLWAKETVMAENEKLKEKVTHLQHDNDTLQAYIEGMRMGQRAVRKIYIKGEEVVSK